MERMQCQQAVSNSTVHEKKTKLEKLITQIWEFLEQYVDLLNTHGAEFYSFSHWESFAPVDVRPLLLSLSDDQLCDLPIEYLVEEISLSDDSADELKNLGIAKKWLNDFLLTAKSFHIENADVLERLEDILVEDARDDAEVISEARDVGEVISEAMCLKKIHEVGIMSKVITTLCHTWQADLVVDIGSGKGYLSCELARQHKVPVLGLDSSEGNTHSATVRDKRLSQKWEGLTRRQNKTNKVKKNTINTESNKEKKQVQITDKFELENNTAIFSDNRNDSDSYNVNPVFKNLASCDSCDNLPKSDNSTHLGCDKTNLQEKIPADVASESDDNRLYVPLTMCVQPGMNVRQILASHAPHLFREKSQEDVRIFIAGLHTCGSLAVTSMRLFLEESSAVGLCCVGCCYQLMDEAGTHHNSNELNSQFPLSRCSKRKQIHLGRNARNLASQAVHRIHASRQLQGGQFFWRALLDVLLRTLDIPVPERIIGMRGLVKRCKSFYDYIILSFKKLGLPTDKVVQEEIEALERKYTPERQKMTAFFQLKLVLAPVIETLILADRCLYLLEQECVDEAYLVQVFNNVTSPRCCALIAKKKI